MENMNDAAKIQGIANRFESIEHDLVPLPSKGFFYPRNDDGTRIESIRVAYLTGEDENVLLSPNLIKQNKVIEELLRRKVIDNRVTADQLISADRIAILFWLRSTGLSPEYNVKLTDPETGDSFDHTFLLDSLNYQTVEEKDVDENGLLQGKTDKYTFKFRMLNHAEEIRIEKDIQDRQTKLGVSYVQNSQTLILSNQIIELNGKTDKGEIQTTLNNMRLGDIRKIKKVIADKEPQVVLKQEVQLPSGNFQDFPIPLTADFFFPDI